MCGIVYSQTNEHLSSFNMVSFTYKHDKKWMAYLELQTRSIEEFSKPDYYEVKGGIGYNIDKNNQPLIGLGRYGTYKDSKFYRDWETDRKSTRLNSSHSG